MEIAGIEPATFCMLSRRATNCAKPPEGLLLYLYTHIYNIYTNLFSDLHSLFTLENEGIT